MIAVDTNIVVRLITGDEPRQKRIIEERMHEGLFISHGVLMETEWVLRSSYRLNRDQIFDALLGLLSLDLVRVPRLTSVFWALDRFGEGADWADMLHVIAARGCRLLATFDEDFAKHARTDSLLEVELLK